MQNHQATRESGKVREYSFRQSNCLWAARPVARLRPAALVILAVLLGLGGVDRLATACTTPVYRYAMYNWASSPFVVCYLYRGKPDAEDEALNRTIAEAGNAKPATANIVLESIDLETWKPERLPPAVRKTLEARAEGALPAYVVLTPWGAELPVEQFDKAAAAALIDSPVRARLGEMLDQGNAAAFLLLPGADAAENQRVESVIRETIAKAASGQIAVASMDDPTAPGMPGQPVDPSSDDQTAAAGRLELGMVKLDRSDPAEQWFLRTLMHVEPDLHEYQDEPMVFAVYGRGRAMEPYIGKGITAENLSDLVAFLAGACSCMVKEQNPGVDLLFRWDWDSTADRMAENDPTLAPPDMGYQEFAASSPASEEQPADSAVEDTAKETAAGSDEMASAVQAESKPAVADEPEPVVAAGAPSPPEAAEASVVQPAPVGTMEPQPLSSQSLASRQMWTVGLGVALGAIIVLAAGIVLVRRQSP